MNDYRITYTGESEGFQTITERTEAAAKKLFLASNKSIKLDIVSVELYRENTLATKDQERAALEAIKKMVAELGPQSYLATAFAGCFADAENNIENDFGDSMKGRLEYAEGQLAAIQHEVKDLRLKLAQSEEKHRGKIGEVQELRHLLERAHKATEGLEELEVIFCEQAEDAEHKAAEAAERIVQYSDNPDSEEFKAAVRERRNFLELADYNKTLAGRVSGYMTAARVGV
jgi:predicted nuclease with TOPRIM domain